MMGWDFVSVEVQPLLCSLSIPQVITPVDDNISGCESPVEWYWKGKIKWLWEKPVPVPLFPPQIHKWTTLGASPGLCGEKPMTSHLCCGKGSFRTWWNHSTSCHLWCVTHCYVMLYNSSWEYMHITLNFYFCSQSVPWTKMCNLLASFSNYEFCLWVKFISLPCPTSCVSKLTVVETALCVMLGVRSVGSNMIKLF
jgi:hypothetical protein